MARVVVGYQPDNTSPIIAMPDGSKWCLSIYDEGSVGQFANVLLYRLFPVGALPEPAGLGVWEWTTPDKQPYGSFFEHWDTPDDYPKAVARHGDVGDFVLDFMTFAMKTIKANTGFSVPVTTVDDLISDLGAWMLTAYPPDPRLILAQVK